MILSSFATLHNTNSSVREIRQYKQTSKLKKTELLLIGYFVSGLTLDAVFTGINQYNEALRIIALKNNCGWVDNAAMIPHEERYFVDRVHFSHLGAASMAKNLYPAVVQELKKM